MKPRASDLVRGRPTGVELVLELPRTSQAPGVARRWLVESFAEVLDSSAREKAKLLVSELVTNAVVHGRGRIEIRVRLDRERLLVEVIDEGPGFTPDVRERDPDTPGGDGFRIVDEEASGWGVGEGGARVWFELRRPAGIGPRDHGSHRQCAPATREPSMGSARRQASKSRSRVIAPHNSQPGEGQ